MPTRATRSVAAARTATSSPTLATATPARASPVTRVPVSAIAEFGGPPRAEPRGSPPWGPVDTTRRQREVGSRAQTTPGSARPSAAPGGTPTERKSDSPPRTHGLGRWSNPPSTRGLRSADPPGNQAVQPESPGPHVRGLQQAFEDLLGSAPTSAAPPLPEGGPRVVYGSPSEIPVDLPKTRIAGAAYAKMMAFGGPTRWWLDEVAPGLSEHRRRILGFEISRGITLVECMAAEGLMHTVSFEHAMRSLISAYYAEEYGRPELRDLMRYDPPSELLGRAELKAALKLVERLDKYKPKPRRRGGGGGGSPGSGPNDKSRSNGGPSAALAKSRTYQKGGRASGGATGAGP